MFNKVPLLTLKDEDWLGGEKLNQLEAFIGNKYTCACSSVQIALQSCLELMGTRTDMLPVLMPVTAAPDTLSAVLRSGAHPMLLDVKEDTLQMDPEQVKMALEELDTAIILFTRPGGLPVDETLIELAQDQPSIVDSRLLPHPSMGIEDFPAVFNVFDLTPACGGGGVIVHKFQKQVSQLKIVRSGVMGHSGALSEPQAELALQRLNSIKEFVTIHSSVAADLTSHLNALDRDDILTYPAAKWPSPLYIRVPNAKRVAAHLNTYGIETALGVYPLCRLKEVYIRYKEEPDYPVAEKLSNEVLCLPTHSGVWGNESKIVEWISEVV